MEFTPEGPMAIPMWVNGHAYLSVGSAFFEISDLTTGENIRRVPLCGAAEAAVAVEAAKVAQPGWAAMGLMARRVCLDNLANELDRLQGHFAKLLQQEVTGNNEAAVAQVEAAVAALRDAAVGETGVVGVIVDAQTPLSSLAQIIGPAVMAGAALVVKPSPKAPSAIFALCELASRAEWPAGVLNLLQGDREAIEGLCAAGVERVVYRGESALGQQIGEMAARAGVRFELQAA